jgi:hypothetical protein
MHRASIPLLAVQSISYRNAMFQPIMADKPGFRMEEIMCDIVHPNALGHRWQPAQRSPALQESWPLAGDQGAVAAQAWQHDVSRERSALRESGCRESVAVWCIAGYWHMPALRYCMQYSLKGGCLSYA